jgi:hypothetical protein
MKSNDLTYAVGENGERLFGRIKRLTRVLVKRVA